MDTILPGELPYIIGFVGLVVLAFWLVGHAAERGWWDRPARPGALLILAILFGAQATLRVIDHDWLWAALFGVGSIYYLGSGWRRRQRG